MLRSNPAALILFFILCALQSYADKSRYTGEISGAEYIIDVPANASGNTLFLARGYRPESLPLSAIYEEETVFFQRLLSEGWTIASTSFRHRGWIMADGAEDLIALRDLIEQSIHPIDRAFLYGESMGGGIVCWLAEQKPNSFDGAIALGAYLYAEPKGKTPPDPELAYYLKGKPGFPIVLLTNNIESEVAGSRAYAKHAKDGAYPPVLWTVERMGHVNLNSAERLAALQAILEWSSSDQIPESGNATIEMNPASVSAIYRETAAGIITRTRPLYGNIYTSFVKSDLEALNIELGDRFAFTHKGMTVYPVYQTKYSDVPLGEWVAFIDPEGHIQFSRNYENAAKTLGASKGEILIVSALE